MKKVTVGIALVVGVSLASLVQAQEQKVIFCADSVSYVRGKYGVMDASNCKQICAVHSEAGCLENETKAGWQIISTSPKSVPEYGSDSGGASCSCVGTQYVLKKEAEKVEAPMASEKIMLLEKEIELLKKENEMLQQELNALKTKSTASKKKP